MAASLVLSLASLTAVARAIAIESTLQSLAWKYNNTDFWAPIHLESSGYYLQGPAGELPASISRRGLGKSQKSAKYLGCTVATIPASTKTLSAKTVEDIIAKFSVDDIWSSEQFLDCLYLQHDGRKSSLPIDRSLNDFITKNGVEILFLSPSLKIKGFKSKAVISTVESSDLLSNGPYVASPGDMDGVSMTPVYTVHPDAYEAFMAGSIPDSEVPGKHQQMQVSLPGTRLPHIIVPSKLASTNEDAGPLAGLRFAVKDLFHITGLKTSGGSKSYYQAFGYQNFTTETVQITLDAGASLVGKTKTIAFALGAPRNGMEVDYPNPWSSRGDGYQNTGGSSSGSGAAVTAYEWIDFALGSDTGGSVRFPARYGGLYGYKPTHGIFNTTGILVAIAEQDTPGFLTRSPEIFTRLGAVWTAGRPLRPLPESLPRKLLRYADQPTVVSQPEVATMIEAFFASMTSTLELDSAPASINMTAAFLTANVSKTSPPQILSEFLQHVYSDQNSVQCWDEVGAPLAAAYAQIPGKDGAFPPVDPPVNLTFADGQNATTRSRYPESQRRRQVFGDWFNEAVLPVSEDTCSEYIFVHTYHTPPNTVKVDAGAAAKLTGGWYDGVYTNYAGAPEIVVPIGQVQYWSPYTQRLEWQPVTVALGVARGCDLVLFELVDRLAEKGLLKETLPGVVAYAVEA